MRLIKIAAAALIVVLMSSVIACGSSSSQETSKGTPQETPKLTTYTNNSLGFSIFVPVSWNETPLSEGVTIFVSPLKCSEGLIIASVSKDEASGRSLQTFYQWVKSNSEAYESYTFISEDEIAVHGMPAMELVFSYNVGHPAFSVKMMTYVLVDGQIFWTIGFQCVPACWSTYEGTFNTMLDSFQALK